MQEYTASNETPGREGTRAQTSGKNRLAHEKSPYLLQHANNPVNWYPWGDEAFETAKREDKPIFLSIGYSTCHWCHVMEHETFEDEEAAKVINDVFVPVKVDREERPDIDNIYMTVCQMMTGSGGWPLSIIMTPDKKPFFAATYIPRDTMMGRIGMIELSHRIKEIWTTRRDEVIQSAGSIHDALKQLPDDAPGEAPGEETLTAGFDQLKERFDDVYGGFGSAPKFPSPHNFTFLLRYWNRTGADPALKMVETTLQAMRRGGIYDHVGFGFHRYSTDARWLLPHFEKMLYDQALLAMAYTEAYQVTGNERYKQTAEEIFTYVARDLTSEEGAFFSAEDADSEGEEGKFYVWTVKELREVLADDAELITKVFNAQDLGNFREEATGKVTGANILHLRKDLSEIASDMGMPEDELRAKIESARQKLLAAREQRIRPHLDDKILTDWNGLMIAALAKAAKAFETPEHARTAEKALTFILENMRKPDGRLFHRFRAGEAAIQANLDDYAFLIWGLLELYEATFNPEHLETALSLNTRAIAHFWDDRAGGFFFTADDAEDLLVRKKEIYDGALPSGNSVMALNLMRLSRMTGNTELEHRAEDVLRAFSGSVRQLPSGFTQFLSAVEFAKGPSYEVVIAGEKDAEDTGEMVSQLRRTYTPNTVVLLRPAGEDPGKIGELSSFVGAQQSADGKATAYVCRNFGCEFPTTDPQKMLELLGKKNP